MYNTGRGYWDESTFFINVKWLFSCHFSMMKMFRFEIEVNRKAWNAYMYLQKNNFDIDK